MRKPIYFNGYKCRLARSRYANGANALFLLDWETGEHMAKCSTNLVNEEVGEDEVFIKDYAENMGMVYALQRANIISERPIRVVDSGFTTIGLYKILPVE